MPEQRSQRPLAVLGAGSWGTALAVQLARTGHPTVLWGRDGAQVAAMQAARENARYLPGISFPAALRVESELGNAAGRDTDILVCVPSHGFRTTLESVRPLLSDDVRLAWATKGFEQHSGKLPHEIAREVLGASVQVAVLSGPTFAHEVGKRLPTAMTIAGSDTGFATDLARAFSDHLFRVYTSGDMVGVEVGGAVKNVIAIGAGISDGLGFGANTRIALICRGLNEMTRLGVCLGADAQTLMGLSGMGDLVLTSTDDQSRNRRLGLALAAGESTATFETSLGQVVEGVYAARAVRGVASRLGIEMPICEQVYRIVHEGAAPQDAVLALMQRDIKPELG